MLTYTRLETTASPTGQNQLLQIQQLIQIFPTNGLTFSVLFQIKQIQMRWSISSQHCHYYFSRIMYWDDVPEFLTHSEWFLLWVTEHLCVFFSVTDDWLHSCLLAASVPHAAPVSDGVFQNTVDDALTWQRQLAELLSLKISTVLLL